jgi:hypothetical protein
MIGLSNPDLADPRIRYLWRTTATCETVSKVFHRHGEDLKERDVRIEYGELGASESGFDLFFIANVVPEP